MGAILGQLAATIGDEGSAERVRLLPGATGLTARLRAGELALDSVSFFAAQAARMLRLPSLDVNPRRVGVNFSSYNYLSVDGVPAAAWAPLSGFFPTLDGWVRTHANYPHHRARLGAAFGLDESGGRDEFAAVLAGMSAADAEALALARGALCVRVRGEEEFARLIPPAPLLEWEPAAAVEPGAAPDHATRPPRVLDFSRVIAGPTCTRALALLGADVLRIDPPEPAEIAVQHLDTGAGKRTSPCSATGRAAWPDSASTRRACARGIRTSSSPRSVPTRRAAPGRCGAASTHWCRRHPASRWPRGAWRQSSRAESWGGP